MRWGRLYWKIKITLFPKNCVFIFYKDLSKDLSKDFRTTDLILQYQKLETRIFWQFLPLLYFIRKRYYCSDRKHSMWILCRWSLFFNVSWILKSFWILWLSMFITILNIFKVFAIDIEEFPFILMKNKNINWKKGLVLRDTITPSRVSVPGTRYYYTTEVYMPQVDE